MTGVMRGYITAVDTMNRRLGRVVMYGIFAIMAILLWSSMSKTFFDPSLWTLEMAQFAMVTYYVLGGPYAVQTGANCSDSTAPGSAGDAARASAPAPTATTHARCTTRSAETSGAR